MTAKHVHSMHCEANMTALKTLKFIEAPNLNKADPREQRRMKLAAQLEQQKLMLTDPNFTVMQVKWSKDEAGAKVRKETPKRLRRWWQEAGDNNFVLVVRYGTKPIEFEKGKPAIAAVGKDGLVKVIDTLIVATKAGELDELLAAGRKS